MLISFGLLLLWMILFFLHLQKVFRFSFNMYLYALDSLMCIQKMQKKNKQLFFLLEYLSVSKIKGYVQLTGLISVL